MDWVFWIDEPAENLRKQNRADNECNGTKTLNGALQFALFAFADPMRHHALRGRHGNVPERNHWNGCEQPGTGFRETGQEHAARAKHLADVEGPFFTESFDHSTG